MVSNRLFLIVSLVLCVSPAWGQGSPPLTASQKETARNLMHRGDQKLNGGDERAALEAYEAADAIMGVPTTALAVGKARARLGYLVEAVDALGRVRRYPPAPDEPAAFTAAREEAARLDADLARRIPVITITVHGPSEETPVELVVDGVQHGAFLRGQPLRLNPGRHTLTFDAPGYHAASRTVSLEEEAETSLRLTLAPDPTEHTKAPDRAVPRPSVDGVPNPIDGAPSAEDGLWATMAIASFAVGGAGLVAGAITGGLAASEASAMEGRCGGTQCSPAERPAHDRIDTLAHASNVTLVVGGLGIAAGITSLVLELTGPGDPDEAQVTPLLGPTGGGIRVRF